MQLIIDNLVVEDSWLPADPEATGASADRIATLEQWLDAPHLPAVEVSPGEDFDPLLSVTADLKLIVVNFPDMTDGRGFSIARALREAGYTGELRAAGRFIRDQLHYLRRCGFNAFNLPVGTTPEAALKSLHEFSVSYQAAQDEPEPLFKRMR